MAALKSLANCIRCFEACPTCVLCRDNPLPPPGCQRSNALTPFYGTCFCGWCWPVFNTGLGGDPYVPVCDSYINKTTTAVTHLCSLVKRVCIVNLCVVSLCIVNKPWLLLQH